MSGRVDEFESFRARLNDKILAEDNQVIRRFLALDTQTYKPGALDGKTKELLGLVASMVLRCDDCIAYHIGQSRDAGVDRDSTPAPGRRFPRATRGARRDRGRLKTRAASDLPAASSIIS